MGNVSGIVAAGLELQLRIFSNLYSCPTAVYSEVIGPFSTSTSLTVSASLPADNLLTITGTATDCSGSPVSSGTAIIYAGPYNYYNTTILNGTYTLSVLNCSSIDTVKVIGINYSNGSQGSSAAVPVSGNVVTIPAITVCAGSAAASFSFGNSQGNCTVIVVGDTIFRPGVPVSPNTFISLPVVVASTGSYNITTGIVNGLSFSGTGTFSNTGQQNVYLTAGGTPVASGNTSFTCQAGAVTGCPFIVNVLGNAEIDLTSCDNLVVYGHYSVGTPMNNTNFVTVTLNVIVPGNYNFSAWNPDASSFVSTGTVTTTGPHNFVLRGEQVVPPGTLGTEYTIDVGCYFMVTIDDPPTQPAAYILQGAPGACALATVNGTFSAGVPVSAQASITLQVNVLNSGYWSITTDNVNGVSFSGSGFFATGGPTTIQLSALGTPESGGTFTYIPIPYTGTGCSFTVPVN